MKLGIPIWQNRISPVMDSARRFLVCEIQDGVVTERSEGAIEGGHPWRLVRFLLDQGIQEILCGAISRPLSSMLTGQGITLYPWVSGEVEAVLEAYLAGELPNERFSLPGCRGGRMRGRHHDFPADWESPGSSWRQEPGAGRRFPRGRGGGYGKGKGRGGGGRGRGGGGGGGRGGGRGRGGGGGGGGGRGGGRGRGGGGGGGRGGGRGRGDERGMKNRIQQKEKEKEDA